MRTFLIIALGLLALGAASWGGESGGVGKTGGAGLVKATFAGGCFWCMEPPFEQLEGVVSVTAGYTGGETVNPTYEEVSTGRTGHAEAVEILFDPARISYTQLLEVFWMNIDPTDDDGQFSDRGDQYRTAIFFHDAEQERLARESKAKQQASGRYRSAILTQIVPAGPFYPAEEEHQDYYRKNPRQYKEYRTGSGRDRIRKDLWGEENR